MRGGEGAAEDFRGSANSATNTESKRFSGVRLVGGGKWGTMSQSGVHVSLRQDAGWGSRSVAADRQSTRG